MILILLRAAKPTFQYPTPQATIFFGLPQLCFLALNLYQPGISDLQQVLSWILVYLHCFLHYLASHFLQVLYLLCFLRFLDLLLVCQICRVLHITLILLWRAQSQTPPITPQPWSLPQFFFCPACHSILCPSQTPNYLHFISASCGESLDSFKSGHSWAWCTRQHANSYQWPLLFSIPPTRLRGSPGAPPRSRTGRPHNFWKPS